MAPKELLPLIQQLKDWRHANGFSQYEAARVLRDAGIPVDHRFAAGLGNRPLEPAGARRLGAGRIFPKAVEA